MSSSTRWKPGGGGGAITEIMSSGAEALAGHDPEPIYLDTPYTWPLTAMTSLAPGEQVWNAGRNYQGFRLFSAYLLFNYRGFDTRPLLPTSQEPSRGFGDDLLHRWARADGNQLSTLGHQLRDAACPECALKPYFKTSTGDTLAPWERLNVLLHNWRVANYVNNVALADSQFGYPPEFGFTPNQDVGAWTDNDGVTWDNTVAIPPEIVITSSLATRETTVVGTRFSGTLGHPMRLQMLGSEYWVLRHDGSLPAGADLVIRVDPESVFYYREVWHSTPEEIAEGEPDSVVTTREARLTASVVAYLEDSETLWDTPAQARIEPAMLPRFVDLEVPEGGLEFVVPSFGDTHHAAVLVISLGDGPSQFYASQPSIGRPNPSNTFPYRMSVTVRTEPALDPSPQVAVSAAIAQALSHPAWSPAGDQLTFSGLESLSGFHQIYRADLGTGMPEILAPQAAHQGRPDWSPRGDWIVFESDSAGTGPQDLWLYDVAEESASPFVTASHRQRWPAFSPNGRFVAYANETSAGWELRRIAVGGTGGTALTGPLGDEIRSVRWAPDGKSILFVHRDTLYAVAATGSVAAVEGGFGDVSTCDGSPAGGALAIEQNSYFRYRLIRDGAVQFSGFGQLPFRRLLIEDPAFGDLRPRFFRRDASFHHPRWSPDGTRIAYASDQNGGDRDLFIGQVSYNHAPLWDTVPGDVTVTACGPVTIQLDASDADGEVVRYFGAMLPATATVDSVSGVFTWDPPLSGEHYVVFRARDGSGGVARRVVRISVPDSVRPAPVEITGVFASSTSVGLEWTAVGDDSLTGTACRYEIRRHSSTITEGNWNSTTPVANSIAPAAPGNSELIEVTGLQPNTWYWFAIKTRDEAGDHLAALSNVVSVKTLSGGGGGGMGAAARRAGDAEGEGHAGAEADAPAAAATGGEVTATRAPFERGAESTSLAGSGEAIAAEFARAGEGLFWRIYRLDSDEATALGGRGGAVGLLLQAPSAEGWETRASLALSAACSLAALMPPDRAPGRAVLPGGHDLTLVFAGAAFAGTAYQVASATHTRLGDLLEQLAPSTGTFELAQGDTLALAYAAAGAADGAASAAFLLFRGTGTTGAGAASRTAEAEAPLPRAFALAQNRPNPFAAATRIHFDLPRAAHVRLEVFDLFGRRVAMLADHAFPAGFHAVDWDRRAHAGGRVPPGVYVYRMQAGTFTAQRKLVLLP